MRRPSGDRLEFGPETRGRKLFESSSVGPAFLVAIGVGFGVGTGVGFGVALAIGVALATGTGVGASDSSESVCAKD